MFGVAVRAHGTGLAAAAPGGLALQLHRQRHVVDGVCEKSVRQQNVSREAKVKSKLSYYTTLPFHLNQSDVSNRLVAVA